MEGMHETLITQECQRAIHSAAALGATEAEITVGRSVVTYSDNNGRSIRWQSNEEISRLSQGFIGRIHDYPVPKTIRVKVTVSGQERHQTLLGHSRTLQHIGESDVRTGLTQSGRYRVRLVETVRHETCRIITTDGTLSRRVPRMHLTAMTTASRDPGTPVTRRNYGVVAEPAIRNIGATSAQDIDEVIDAACVLFGQTLGAYETAGGYAWSEYAWPLDEEPRLGIRLPEGPRDRPEIRIATENEEEMLMPERALALRIAHPMATAIREAWKLMPAGEWRLVQTQDEKVPGLEMRAVRFTELDGSEGGTGVLETRHRKSMRLVREITIECVIREAGKEVDTIELDAPIFISVREGGHQQLLVAAKHGPQERQGMKMLTGLEESAVAQADYLRTLLADHHAYRLNAKPETWGEEDPAERSEMIANLLADLTAEADLNSQGRDQTMIVTSRDGSVTITIANGD